nr:sugar phosphate isomerase/epimerase [Metabacillus litoralis]
MKSRGTRVYLHHPMKYKSKYLDIISGDPNMRKFYDWSCEVLADICKKEEIKCVIHCHYMQSESSSIKEKNKRLETKQRIKEILTICSKTFLWEDTTQGIFSAKNPYLLSEIVQPLHLSLNIDISHSFIALNGDNLALKNHLEQYHSYADYFHLVDSYGVEHDSLPLGKGKIDWSMVKPFIGDADFIFEIDLQASNYLDCELMINSARYYNEI